MLVSYLHIWIEMMLLTGKSLHMAFKKSGTFPIAWGQLIAKKPPRSGTMFFNYKRFFSLKLLSTCDAFDRFTWIDVGNFIIKSKKIIFSIIIV